MAEATTFQAPPSDREEKRATIKEWLAEMDRLHQENVESQQRIDQLDMEIDARLASIDATLARLAAS